jgi:hypothetical protein
MDFIPLKNFLRNKIEGPCILIDLYEKTGEYSRHIDCFGGMEEDRRNLMSRDDEEKKQRNFRVPHHGNYVNIHY